MTNSGLSFHAICERTRIGKTVDVIGFAEWLLGISAKLGKVTLDFQAPNRIRLASGDRIEVYPVDYAAAKHRAICARVAALVSAGEGSTMSPSPYGGTSQLLIEGDQIVDVDFINTPGRHYVTLEIQRAQVE